MQPLYISCLRYQTLKVDLPLIIVEIWPDLPKVASAAPGEYHMPINSSATGQEVGLEGLEPQYFAIYIKD